VADEFKEELWHTYIELLGCRGVKLFISAKEALYEE
jgi:hypothetical protein